MPHKTTRGKAVYYAGQGADARYAGCEWFSVTRMADGQQILRAQCELLDGLIAPREVLREVTYVADAQFRPIECFNRVHVNGAFAGSGWMRFTDDTLTCESTSALHGRMTQSIALARPALSLCSHPLSSDAMALARYDHSRPEPIQHQGDYWMSSLEHDGGAAPMPGSLALDIEYCGRETVTVAAGTFETDHYRFLITEASGSTGEPHPTEDLWCIPGDYVFVKATVGGHMNGSFELVEYSPWQ